MNTVYIVSDFGISITFVVNEMEAHEKAGWKILSLASSKESMQENLSGVMAKWHGRSVYRADLRANILATAKEILCHPLRVLKVCLWLLGMLFHSPSEFAKALYETTNLCYFASRCRRFNAEHIHVHFASRSLNLGLMIGILTDLPVSCTAHAFDIFTRTPGSLRQRLPKCKFIAVISNFNIEYLRKKCSDKVADLCRIVHCGIDLKMFDVLTRKPEPGKIVCVARLVPAKGLDIAIKACAELKRQNVDFVFDIIGTGAEYQTLAELIKQLKLEDYVRLVGPKANDELVPILSKASLFLMPCVTTSSGDMDGIPVAMMEAMACRVPVVSTRISGIPELIEHNVSGFLVPEKDVEALADILKDALADIDRLAQLGEKARQHVCAEFDIRKNAAGLRELIGAK